MPRQLFLVFAAVTLLGSTLYLVMTFSTTYLTSLVGFDWGPTFTYVVAAGAIAVVIGPVSGLISDKLGNRRNYLLGVTAYVALATIWFFSSAPGADPVSLLAPWLALAVGFGLICGVPYALMSELLPTRVRSTGSAISYNLAMAIFGGSAPFIASSLIKWTGDVSSPVWYFVSTAVVSAVGLLMLRPRDLLGVGRPSEGEE